MTREQKSAIAYTYKLYFNGNRWTHICIPGTREDATVAPAPKRATLRERVLAYIERTTLFTIRQIVKALEVDRVDTSNIIRVLCEHGYLRIVAECKGQYKPYFVYTLASRGDDDPEIAAFLANLPPAEERRTHRDAVLAYMVERQEATLGEMCNRLGRRKEQIRQAVNRMIERGELQIVRIDPHGATGRFVYALANQGEEYDR